MKFVVCFILALLCIQQVSAQFGSTDKIVDDLTVYLGGDQVPSTGPAGNHITTYNIQESKWAAFNWGCNGIVRQIKVVDESIYLAGDFSQCDNTYYGPLVKYDIPSGEFQGLLPSDAYWMNSYDTVTGEFGTPLSVRDFQLYKGVLYFVGLFAINFTSTNTLASNVAAVDIRSGEFKTFGEGLNAQVNSLWVQDEKTILFVGRFTRSGYGATDDESDFFTDPGFAVWHEDHFRYGTGYMSYTIPVSKNNFDKKFTLEGYEVYSVWRGLIQIFPFGHTINVPIENPEPERLTIIITGNFPGGVIYQQDSLPWHRPNGGIWGGPVYRLTPFPEKNAFFFAGAFTHAGDENITLATPLGAVTQWNYQVLVGNSNPVPYWDPLEGGVSDGEVFGLAYEAKYSLITLAGSFSGPYEKVTYFDLNRQEYFPFGEGNEFSADLYSVTIANTQVSTNIWSGVWDTPNFIGDIATCVVGNQFFGSTGFVVFEGTISGNGNGVSGVFYTAGASEYPNRGTFAIVKSADAMSFSGYYSYDGVMGKNDFTATRLAFSQPDLLVDCLAVDNAEGGTLAGEWYVLDSNTTLLDLCLIGLESAYGSTNFNGGRYYTGLVGFPGKTVQAQYFDAYGYGMSLFRQSDQNQMVEYWFAGDLREFDPTKDCVLGVTCGSTIWVRNSSDVYFNSTFNTTEYIDAKCKVYESYNAFTGTWSTCGGKADSLLYLRPAGNGLVHGAGLDFLLEGKLLDPYTLKGNWIGGGWGEVTGFLSGEFTFTIDVGQPWEGRSLHGKFTMPQLDSPFPYTFSCNSQRFSSVLPLPEPAYYRSPSAAATVEGMWLKPNGDILNVCVIEPNQGSDATVHASLGKERYYLGDAFTITADHIWYFSSYSGSISTSSGRDTATLNYYGETSTQQGVAIIRRISATQLEETWIQIPPPPADGSALTGYVDFDLHYCTAETCQLADRGTNSVLYTYLGPPKTSSCETASDLSRYNPNGIKK